MNATRWSRRAALASSGLLAIVGVLASQPGGLELTVAPVGSGAPLLVAPLEPGERFTLRYVHSVDRQPVWEVHAADPDGRIFVEEERFVMVGAGMGDLPGRGVWTGDGRTQAIRGMHYPVGAFVLRVGSPGVDHTILWRGTETHLSAMAAGKAVRVEARPVSRLHRLWRRVFPHPAKPTEDGTCGGPGRRGGDDE